MKITGISIFEVDLPYVGGTYAWGNGNAITVAKSSVVIVETDAGISGVGEFCPCGENYMAAHSGGVAATARLLAPVLIGEDPCHISRIERLMDRTVTGHGYAKAPFDAAMWDILGKSLGTPVWMLLGGKQTDGAPLYRVAPQKSPTETEAEIEEHRSAGYRQFQIKVGADPDSDIERIRTIVPMLKPGEKAFADANRGWRVDEALKVARATRDLDYVFEQPCRTYEECLQVRERIDLPMKLDEIVDGMGIVQRIVNDRAAEVVCLKISNLGGLSKARRARDFLIDNGLPVVAEDTWGGEICTATVSHFAASTPADMLVCTTDLHNYNTRSTGFPGPMTKDGMMFVSDAPGLGVEVDRKSLGAPVAAYGQGIAA